MVAVYVSVKGTGRGNIQQVAVRAAYAIPSRHKAAARRRRRRNSFNSCNNFTHVWRLERALRRQPRLMRPGTGLEPRAGNNVSRRQVDVAGEGRDSERQGAENN